MENRIAFNKSSARSELGNERVQSQFSKDNKYNNNAISVLKNTLCLSISESVLDVQYLQVYITMLVVYVNIVGKYKRNVCERCKMCKCTVHFVK